MSFSVQTGLGLKEQKAPIFNVYPNPFEESFTIDLPHLNSSDYTIEVFNLLGAKLVEQTSTGGRIDIDLGDVDAGIYFVKVNKGDNINMIQLNKINQ
ncbi:MAG: T9SS type A sorting domain-containing protein [Bacteroidetes bacterium]|nr:T9SS type A sorting domain-containing protein [Bacteroidota bacterium]